MFPIIYNYYIEHFHLKIMLFEYVLTCGRKKIKIRIRPFRSDFRKLWADELCLKIVGHTKINHTYTIIFIQMVSFIKVMPKNIGIYLFFFFFFAFVELKFYFFLTYGNAGRLIPILFWVWIRLRNIYFFWGGAFSAGQSSWSCIKLWRVWRVGE